LNRPIDEAILTAILLSAFCSRKPAQANGASVPDIWQAKILTEASHAVFADVLKASDGKTPVGTSFRHGHSGQGFLRNPPSFMLTVVTAKSGDTTFCPITRAFGRLDRTGGLSGMVSALRFTLLWPLNIASI
jgi:hypothetical protein